MNAINHEDTELQEEFLNKIKEEQKDYGHVFLYGHVNHPYDGCFWRHCPAFPYTAKDGREYLFLTIDLGETCYKRLREDVPKELEDGVYDELLDAGCILAENWECVLSDPGYPAVTPEIHPLDKLEPNTPYALYGHVLEMCEALGYPRPKGFKCKCCGRELYDREDTMYFETEFRGNGGIGIEVDAPVCSDCYYTHMCAYCGAEEPNSPWLLDLDDAGHCIHCITEEYQYVCRLCDEVIKVWQISTPEDVEAFQNNLCEDCQELENRAQVELERYKEIDARSGDLFNQQSVDQKEE